MMMSSNKVLKIGDSPNINKKDFLCCFYHPFKKAVYSLAKTKDSPLSVNMCMKCSIQKASLGQSVFKIKNVLPQKDNENRNFENNPFNKITYQIRNQNNSRKYSQVNQLSKKLKKLLSLYQERAEYQTKIIKLSSKKLFDIKSIYSQIIGRLKSLFLTISNDHREAIRNNRLWYQRTCQSLVLITKVVRDLEENINRYGEFLIFNLNDSQENFDQNQNIKNQQHNLSFGWCKQTQNKQGFYQSILKFYGMEYYELENQMKSTEGLRYQGNCFKMILDSVLELCQKISKEIFAQQLKGKIELRMDCAKNQPNQSAKYCFYHQ